MSAMPQAGGVTVVIPTYNEAESIAAVVAELPRDPNGKLYKRRLRDPYWVGRDRAI